MAKKRRSSQFKDSSQVIDIEEARRKRQEKRRRQRGKQSGAAVQEKTVRASIRQNKRRRTLIYTAIIVAIIAVVGMSVYNIVSLKQEQKETKAQNEKLKEQKASLQKQLEKLDDSEYIEEQARAQLRLVMPGENIYVFPSLDEEKAEAQKENKEKDED